MSLNLRKRLAAVLGCSILAGAVASATNSRAEYKGYSVDFIEEASKQLGEGLTLGDAGLIDPNTDPENFGFDQLTEKGRVFVHYLGKKYFENKLDFVDVRGLSEHNSVFFRLVVDRGEQKVRRVLESISPLTGQIESLSQDIQEVSRGMESVAESLLRSMEKRNSTLMRTAATLEGEEAQQVAYLVEENKKLVSENKQLVEEKESLVSENRQLVEERENLVSENKQFAEEMDRAAADIQKIEDERSRLAEERSQINKERLQAVAGIKAMGRQVQDLKLQMEVLLGEQDSLNQALQKALDGSENPEEGLRETFLGIQRRNFSRSLEEEKGFSEVHSFEDERLEQERQQLTERLQSLASQQEEMQSKTDLLVLQAHQEVLEEAFACVEGEQLSRLLAKFGYDSQTGKLEDEERRKGFMASLEEFGEGVTQPVQERIADVLRKSEEIERTESEEHVPVEDDPIFGEEEEEFNSAHNQYSEVSENQSPKKVGGESKKAGDDGQPPLRGLSKDHHESAESGSEREDHKQTSTRKPKSSDEALALERERESGSESDFDRPVEKSERLSQKAASRGVKSQPVQDEVKDESDRENASASRSDFDQESEHKSRKLSSKKTKQKGDEILEDEANLGGSLENPSEHEEVLPSKAPEVIENQPWVLQDSEQQHQESAANKENLSSASKKQEDEASEHTSEQQVQQDEQPHSEEGGENPSGGSKKEQKDGETPEDTEEAEA